MLDNIETTKSRGDAVSPQLYDYEGAAKYLCVTPRLVRELRARRELSAIKVGRRVRFTEADLVAYIERHRVEAVR